MADLLVNANRDGALRMFGGSESLLVGHQQRGVDHSLWMRTKDMGLGPV